MITYLSTARALTTRRSLTRFSCQRLFLPVLMGTMLLAAGCARKQPSQLVAGQQPPSSGRIEQKLDIVDAARSSIGTPYRFGGTSPATGFDCSGLVCWSYEQVGIQLPRSARDQIMFGTKVERQEDLKPGDIVVFKGTRGRTGWHSGIYTGAGRFVHSPSTGKTVTESRLDEEYYARRFAGARRIPRDGSASELYAQYEAQQKASALADKETKQSRRQLLAANSKTGGKGKTSADKSGKNSAGKAGKNGKATQASAGSKGGLLVAEAGSGKRGQADKAPSGKNAGKGGPKQDTSSNKAGKQPVAASNKPKTEKATKGGGSVQTAKNGNAKTPAKNKNKS